MMCSANVAWSMYPGLTKAAMNVICLKGSDEQKSTYIPKMTMVHLAGQSYRARCGRCWGVNFNSDS